MTHQPKGILFDLGGTLLHQHEFRLAAGMDRLLEIASNAGAEGAVIVEEVRSKKAAFGYNAQSEEYGDVIQMGVVDPTKVVRVAIEKAFEDFQLEGYRFHPHIPAAVAV